MTHLTSVPIACTSLYRGFLPIAVSHGTRTPLRLRERKGWKCARQRSLLRRPVGGSQCHLSSIGSAPTTVLLENTDVFCRWAAAPRRTPSFFMRRYFQADKLLLGRFGGRLAVVVNRCSLSSSGKRGVLVHARQAAWPKCPALGSAAAKRLWNCRGAEGGVAISGGALLRPYRGNRSPQRPFPPPVQLRVWAGG